MQLVVTECNWMYNCKSSSKRYTSGLSYSFRLAASSSFATSIRTNGTSNGWERNLADFWFERKKNREQRDWASKANAGKANACKVNASKATTGQRLRLLTDAGMQLETEFGLKNFLNKNFWKCGMNVESRLSMASKLNALNRMKSLQVAFRHSPAGEQLAVASR